MYKLKALSVFYIIFTLNIHCLDTVTISLSTIIQRQKGLQNTIRTLLPQADKINVFLQGYNYVPHFLRHPKIEVALGKDYPEVERLGACAKFFWADKIKGYHFTVDDDIIYPHDYVKRCISKIEQYKRRAIVGFHGYSFTNKNYEYNNKILYKFFNGLSKDVIVNIMGTGTSAYHTDTFKISLKNFLGRNAADCWFSVEAKKQNVPLVCIARNMNYLRTITELQIIQAVSSDTHSQSERNRIIKKYSPWPLLKIENIFFNKGHCAN